MSLAAGGRGGRGGDGEVEGGLTQSIVGNPQDYFLRIEIISLTTPPISIIIVRTLHQPVLQNQFQRYFRKCSFS